MKYLKIFASFLRISVMNHLEYRVDFVITTFLKLFDSAASFLILFFLISSINHIGDWQKGEVMLLDLTFVLGTAILGLVFQQGLKQFALDLNTNKIDSYLVKPLGLQFFVSFSRWEWTHIFRIILSIIAIIIVANIFNITFRLGNTTMFVSAVIVGVALYYSFSFILIVSVLFLGRIRSIDFLPEALWQYGKMPTPIFGRIMGGFFSVAIPLTFAATVPVGLLTGKYSFVWLFSGILLAIFFLLLSNLLLNVGIKRYSGSGN